MHRGSRDQCVRKLEGMIPPKKRCKMLDGRVDITDPVVRSRCTNGDKVGFLEPWLALKLDLRDK